MLEQPKDTIDGHTKKYNWYVSKTIDNVIASNSDKTSFDKMDLFDIISLLYKTKAYSNKEQAINALATQFSLGPQMRSILSNTSNRLGSI